MGAHCTLGPFLCPHSLSVRGTVAGPAPREPWGRHEDMNMLPPGCTGTGSRACVADGPVWPGPASGWLADHSTGGPGAGTWPDLSLLPGNEAPPDGTGTLWLKMIKTSLLCAGPAGETSGNEEDKTQVRGAGRGGSGRSTKHMRRAGRSHLGAHRARHTCPSCAHLPHGLPAVLGEPGAPSTPGEGPACHGAGRGFLVQGGQAPCGRWCSVDPRPCCLSSSPAGLPAPPPRLQKLPG